MQDCVLIGCGAPLSCTSLISVTGCKWWARWRAHPAACACACAQRVALALALVAPGACLLPSVGLQPSPLAYTLPRSRSSLSSFLCFCFCSCSCL